MKNSNKKNTVFYGEKLFEMIYLRNRLLRYKDFYHLTHSQMMSVFNISRATYYKIINCDNNLNIVMYLKVLAQINNGLLKNIHVNEFSFDTKNMENLIKKAGFFDLDVIKGYFWLSEQVRIVKKEKKLTYEYISEFTGISANTIKGFINKQSIVKAGDVFILLDFLNIKFCNGDGNSYSRKQIDSAIVNIPLIRTEEEVNY